MTFIVFSPFFFLGSLKCPLTNFNFQNFLEKGDEKTKTSPIFLPPPHFRGGGRNI
jgi:hypothetical protein